MFVALALKIAGNCHPSGGGSSTWPQLERNRQKHPKRSANDDFLINKSFSNIFKSHKLQKGNNNTKWTAKEYDGSFSSVFFSHRICLPPL